MTSAAELLKKRMAELRAAKEAQAQGAQSAPTTETKETQDVSVTTAESGNAADAGSNSEERVPESLPAIHSESSHAVVTGEELQPTTLVVVERQEPEPVEHHQGTELQGPSTDLDRSNPVHHGFLQRLADLESALLARDPSMKTHLAAIHRTMIDYDDIPNLLRPEEIAKIMAAQQVHTNTFLAQTTKKSSSAKSKTANLTLDDI